jgi:hypothetical protein
MSTFFEYDPVTGIQETQTWDDGVVTVHQQQDVTELIDQCKHKANWGLTDKGIKQNFWHYADLPLMEVMNLKKRGIDIWDKNCTKDLLKAINRDLPAFKVTQKTHT